MNNLLLAGGGTLEILIKVLRLLLSKIDRMKCAKLESITIIVRGYATEGSTVVPGDLQILIL